MANYTSRGQQRDKPYRDALRIEAKLAEEGEISPAKPGSLRYIARKMLERAAEETNAAKEVADRLDGRVPLAHQHAGAGGGPIQTLDLSRATEMATDEQLAAIESVFARVAVFAGSDPEGGADGEAAPSD